MYIDTIFLLLSFSIIPDSAEKIWKMIGFTSSLENSTWHGVLENELVPGTHLSHPKLLFAKIEDETIEKELAKLQASDSENKKSVLKESDLKDQINFEDFTKLDLRVGKIESAEKVKGSKKLLQFNVSLGFEKRQILSGIAQYYSGQQKGRH